MTRELSKMEVRSAMQRMKNGLTPELIKESLMLWTRKPDEDYIDRVVAAAARRLGLRYRYKYKHIDPSELTDLNLRTAMWRFVEFNQDPEGAKYDIKRWQWPYADCEWIDMTVDEAARRFGLGPRESIYTKTRDDSGRMELATNLMTNVGLSPNRAKKVLMRCTYKLDEEINAAVAEAARRLGLGPNETLRDKN